jgi:hypothetical protein
VAIRQLSGPEAREARILCGCGFSFRSVALLYGVSPSAIAKLVHGETYPDVGGPVRPRIAPADRARPDHGDFLCYRQGCRCPQCREANAARCRAERKRQREQRAAAPDATAGPEDTSPGPPVPLSVP